MLLVTVTSVAAHDDTETGIAQEIRAQLSQDAGPKAQNLATPGVVWLYASRNYTPLWSDRAQLRSLVAALEDTEADGLLPGDYGVVMFRQALASWPDGDARRRAAIDIHITHCFLRALLHLRRGKVDPKALNPRWNIQPDSNDERALLEAAIRATKAGRVEQAFEFARPQHPVYLRLRAALQHARATAAGGGWPSLPDGPPLQPGSHGPAVQALHRRLAAAGYLPAASIRDTYDAETAHAVSWFQSEQLLVVNGIVDRATRDALNAPVEARIDQLRVNLERARWLLHLAKDDFVLVDIAGYMIHYYEDGRPIWSSRVQVGRAVRPTPIVASSISHITLNPAWTVPPTIFRKDLLPKIRRNHGYLAANRLHVLDASGHELDPDDVDWGDPRGIILRQDAGPGGALGRIAIRFPSPYMVYLHETPHTELFDREQRTFSSGCIRVEKPYELASLLLGWERGAIDEIIAKGRTVNVPLPRQVPIFILYWTVSAPAEGRVAFKPDPYRMDPLLLRALNEKFVGAEL
jgi:murein L,D-transpeptidase YcbB/YkuD